MTFQIVSGDMFVVPIHFRMNFRHAAADRKENTAIFLRLRGSNGVEGWGETLTRPYLTGESVESVKSSVNSWWRDLRSINFTSEHPRSVLTPMWTSASENKATAAWAMIDIACYDLWMKSLVTGTGQKPSKTYRVSFPLGIGSRPKLLLPLARALRFKNLKIKTGRNLESTSELLKKLGHYWESVSIDANGSFSAQDIPAVLKILASGRLNFVEQPFARDDFESAAKLVSTKKVRIIADESLCTLKDAQELIRHKAADIFNIRLAKVGGITGALNIATLARTHGIDIQLGALVGETGLLCNAARFVLPDLDPILFEYSFPSVLLKANPVRSDVNVMASELGSLNPRTSGFAAVKTGQMEQSCIERFEFGT